MITPREPSDYEIPEAEEEEPKDEEKLGRGTSSKCRVDQANLIMVWGCEQGSGENADIKCAKSIKNLMLSVATIEDNSVKLPEGFSMLQSSDANFELMASQTGQSLELQHTNNRVGQMIVLYAFNE